MKVKELMISMRAEYMRMDVNISQMLRGSSGIFCGSMSWCPEKKLQMINNAKGSSASVTFRRAIT